MLQSNATVSALDLFASDAQSGARAKPGSKSDGFSQVFDKAVKNTSEKAESDGRERTESKGDPSSAEKARTENKQAQTTAAEKDHEEGKDEDGKDEDGEEKNGKILPLGLTLEKVSEDDLLALEGESEMPQEGDVLPIPGMSVPSQQQTSEPVLSDQSGDEEIPQLLRDFMRQRQLAVGGERPLEPAGKGQMSRAEFSLALGAQVAAPRGNGEAAVPLPPLTTSVMTANPATAATPPAQMTLGHPVQQKGWDQAMAQRVVWMVRNNIQEAQIRLNPRDLGPINVRITVNNDQAHVQFVAQHATTREALENALPRLREMMQEAGMNLAQSDVSQQSQGRGDDSEARRGDHHGEALTGDEGENDPFQHLSHVSPGGVDYYV